MGNTAKMSGGRKALMCTAYLLMILLGCLQFINWMSIVWLFSAAVAIYGIAMIIRYFSTKGNRNGWDIIVGIMNLVFGAIMLFGSAGAKIFGVMLIELYLGIWALFTGIAKIFIGFEQKKAGFKYWGWTVGGAALLTILGLILIIWPLAGTVALVEFVGIFTGIALVILGINGLADTLSD